MELYIAGGIDRAADAGPPWKRSRWSMMPPINRTSMAPRPWKRSREERTAARVLSPIAYRRDTLAPSAIIRRSILFALAIAQTWGAASVMSSVLPYQGRQPIEIAILFLFVILFGWISVGFLTAMAGFFALLFGRDRHVVTANSVRPIPKTARTAVVMPIYNEHVARVFAGLQASYESIARSG